ncbi:unnamed protein product [Danaus chrysippus]|uniref:(African queen) hypothetical protein n=1 Tax=Danaus chrysippus TaxID=151541 RepID=A0A8J2R2B1_9NEOP|nr:unnamed protein product [Danaus chrysippus]
MGLSVDGGRPTLASNKEGPVCRMEIIDRWMIRSFGCRVKAVGRCSWFRVAGVTHMRGQAARKSFIDSRAPKECRGLCWRQNFL